MTSQDFVKGIDITGLTTVTGSEINQSIDTGTPASDKGLIIETQDTSLNVPVVPNPDTLLEGKTPTWWKRYIWKRVGSLDAFQKVKLYTWNPLTISDPTYLLWEEYNADSSEALTEAQAALLAATNAQATADTATTNSQNAIDAAATANTNATNAQNASATNATAIQTLTSQLNNNTYQTGDFRHTSRNTSIFSITVDQGWLICDGSAVSRIVFANLYAAIGTTYGTGDGSTTFNVPDLRGKVLIGENQDQLPNGKNGTLANYLLARSAGEESHLLTSGESGVPAHTHNSTTQRYQADGNTRNTGGAILAIPGPADYSLVSNANIAADASGAHNNMQPYLVGRVLIKT